MDRIEQRIGETLDAEDRALLQNTRDPGLVGQVFGLFRGPAGWLGHGMFAVVTVLFVLGLWCGQRFFASTEVIDAQPWTHASTLFLVVSVQLKMPMMPQMQADRILRARRRLELVLLRAK